MPCDREGLDLVFPPVQALSISPLLNMVDDPEYEKGRSSISCCPMICTSLLRGLRLTMMKRRPAMFPNPYLVEILTPKRSVPDAAREMRRFGRRYRRVIDSGNGLSIPDNPMGQPRYGALETIRLSGLSVDSERIVMNLNTFHTREELHGLLDTATDEGIKYLLVIRGDGGPELPKLDPQSIGGHGSVTTTMDFLRHIHTRYSGRFVTGVAFNQYGRIRFESNRLRQKTDAGAEFVVTQPVVGRDPHVDRLQDLDIPVVIEAWMSPNVDLLYKMVRAQQDQPSEEYDPIRNLQVLHEVYPDSCMYLSMLSFRQ